MKKVVKHFLLLFWSVVRCDDRPKIFFYHDIGTKYTGMGTPDETFWRHMKILAASKYGYRHRVCFDDGYRGLWDARAELKKLIDAGLRIDVFIPVALVGLPEFLTWDEIRVLADDYGVRFQGHTWSHQTLIGDQLSDRAKREIDASGRVTSAWYHHELTASKIEIEKHLGRKVTELCLPVGYFNDEIISKCRQAGYECVYTSIPGNIEGSACLKTWNGYLIPRCLCQYVTEKEFSWVLNGGMLPMANRYFAMHYHKGLTHA